MEPPPQRHALKIENVYDNGVIHVTDASRAVDVVGQLLSSERQGAYLAGIAAEYEEVRTRYARRKGPKLTEIETARENAFQVTEPSVVPASLGRFTLKDYPLEMLRTHIDWTPFLRTWELPGRWPEAADDPKVGEQARQVVADANALLDDWCAANTISAQAVFGLYPVQRDGDDIRVLHPDSREEIFFTLRQRVPRPEVVIIA